MELYPIQKEILGHLKGTDKSLEVTATMGFGLQIVLSRLIEETQGTCMVISSKMMLTSTYQRDILDESVIFKTPQKLAREDISQYTPDLLVVEWPKTNKTHTKWDKIIEQVAKQSKRVVYKMNIHDPKVVMKEYNKAFYVSPDYGVMYAIKEL